MTDEQKAAQSVFEMHLSSSVSEVQRQCLKNAELCRKLDQRLNITIDSIENLREKYEGTEWKVNQHEKDLAHVREQMTEVSGATDKQAAAMRKEWFGKAACRDDKTVTKKEKTEKPAGLPEEP